MLRHSQCRPGESQDDVWGDGVRNCINTVIASGAKQSRVPPRNDSGLLRCARNDGVRETTRVPLVSRTRCSVLMQLRRAGTQKATQTADAWAPALQRTVEETLRCVRGTRPLFIDRHSCSSSRRVSPELCFVASRPMKEGAGKAGSRLAPIGRHAKRGLRYDAQRGNRATGASRPSLRGWLERLMSCSPRGAMHYCPRRLADG